MYPVVSLHQFENEAVKTGQIGDRLVKHVTESLVRMLGRKAKKKGLL
jgi:hypothetical protein